MIYADPAQGGNKTKKDLWNVKDASTGKATGRR